MKVRFLLVLTIVLGILGTATFYIGVHFVTQLEWFARNEKGLWVFSGVLLAIQISGPVFYRAYSHGLRKHYAFYWLSYTLLGIFACLLLYTLASDIIVFAWLTVFKSSDKIRVEHVGFLFALIAATVSVMVGFYQAVGGPKVYHVEVPLKNFPKQFDGFKIVQISDLHIGPTIGRKYVEKVRDIANVLAPDLVAFTGDFVDGDINVLRETFELVGEIKSKHGTFYVTGNHEYYWGAEEWIGEFKKLGVRVLLNEHVLIRENGSSFVLAGVTDRSAGGMIPNHKSDIRKSIAGAAADSAKILLAHQPAAFEAASEAGFDLQLSGHTHGGQFFPWSIFVRFAHRYYKGLNKHKDLWIYVSRGTGYWGPPLRFGVPAEITLIKLNSV